MARRVSETHFHDMASPSIENAGDSSILFIFFRYKVFKFALSIEQKDRDFNKIYFWNKRHYWWENRGKLNSG
jgi:hypothetical protein